MTTVVIIDDSSSIREFLKINLSSEPDIQIVGLADNGERAIAQVEKHQPDIVLMDIEMPGNIDGIEATRQIVWRFPNVKVLLLTSQDDKQQLNRALEAGSRGYILKNSSIQDIASIIELTRKGFFQIGPILGNWDGSLHGNAQLSSNDTNIFGESSHSLEKSAIEQDVNYSLTDLNSSQMNHVLSNLASGLFQLQKTIQSQENTIIGLTNQYSQVQQEIETKLDRNRQGFRPGSNNYYSHRVTFKRGTRRQHFLFIAGFFLGIFTVLFLTLVITII